MGNKYTIKTFYIDEGDKYHSGHESLLKALFVIYKLKRLKHYGCITLEFRD